ncbi:MAG TPA: hypothetical protein VEJ86_08480, partial [Candidatus Binataceae bacterium]|nr:hypothetical protein [Candidatus Binataceae bacterium]
FYLYCLHGPPWFGATVLLVFAVLVFVPIKYIYPNRTVPLRPVTICYGILWALVTIAMLVMLPHINQIMLWASLSYIAYYLLASFGLQISEFAALRRAGVPSR